MNSKNLVRILVAILVIAVATIFLYISSRKSSREIPIIYPDSGETRIKPSEIGGIIIPNSENTIYESLTGSSAIMKKSSDLYEPEQPMIFGKHHSMRSEANMPTNADNIQSRQHNELEINESIFDDELINQEKSSNKKRILNIIKHDKGSGYKIEERNLEGSIDKNYMIQLASVKSEVEGNLVGERIKQKHRKILESYSIMLKKVKAEDGNFFYLVLAGNCPNIGTAKAICKKLSYRQQACMIFKP